MGKMNIVIGDNLEERFRKAVFKKYGMKKGNISIGISDAMELFIKS